MMDMVLELAGLAFLALGIWGVSLVAGSDLPVRSKSFWALAIVVLPVVGLSAWLVAGPRSHDSRV